jgi:hypothetical protein
MKVFLCKVWQVCNFFYVKVLYRSCVTLLHKRDGVVVTVCAQVLLELSDVELEVGLGITHPMHRKKLRLAIEEHRHPALVRYPCIAQLGHTWVSSEWLPDLGLAQASAMISLIRQ